MPGPALGQGIYTDQSVGGPTVNNVLVEENAFKGHDVAGIDVSHTNAAGGAFNLDISTNSFDMNGRAVLLFNTHMSSFHDNDVTNSTETMSAAVRILDNNNNLSILNNDLDVRDRPAITPCVAVVPVFWPKRPISQSRSATGDVVFDVLAPRTTSRSLMTLAGGRSACR